MAAICPWNYPLMMWAWKVAPALAAGCAVLYKPAEQTPLSTLMASELVIEAGFPPGAYSCLTGSGDVTGRALAEHPDVDKVAFTGSTATGRRIVEAAARSNLKKVSLELGGKSAQVVCASADLAEAARWVAFGAFETAGQSCSAGSRVLVHDSVYDGFLALLVAAARQVRRGALDDPATFHGPLVSRIQHDKVSGFVERAVTDGARLALDGRPAARAAGLAFGPTVLADVEPESEVAQAEVFGPVLTVLRFRDDDEAIRIANGTIYGLAAGVHSRGAPALLGRTARALDS